MIIKKIQIERVKEQQARELMRWEAEQHVPFDMESVELDFQILDPDADGVEMSVLLVAAKRELIESKLRILTDAGLEPGIVDVDAFALHNAFEINYPEAMRGIVALVNIGHEVTNINILDDGVPILTRDITVGTRRFREDLQRERGISADEAQQLMQGYDRSAHLDAVLEATRRGDRGRHRARRRVPRVVVAHRRPGARHLHLRRRCAHPRAHRRARGPPAPLRPAGQSAHQPHASVTGRWTASSRMKSHRS